MNHNNSWLSCKNAGRYLRSRELFLDTLPLVGVVKHCIIRRLSQGADGEATVEMRCTGG